MDTRNNPQRQRLRRSSSLERGLIETAYWVTCDVNYEKVSLWLSAQQTTRLNRARRLRKKDWKFSDLKDRPKKVQRWTYMVNGRWFEWGPGNEIILSSCNCPPIGSPQYFMEIEADSKSWALNSCATKLNV